MNKTLSENSLEIHFTDVIEAKEIDNDIETEARNWQRVDWLVETRNELLLIEVKEGGTNNISVKDLSRKARDSFLYLLLMNKLSRDKKVKYIVISKQTDSALLVNQSDDLIKQLEIRNACWPSNAIFINWISSAKMVNYEKWQKQYPKYEIK